jgi:S1-C subfamily serine protease
VELSARPDVNSVADGGNGLERHSFQHPEIFLKRGGGSQKMREKLFVLAFAAASVVIPAFAQSGKVKPATATDAPATLVQFNTGGYLGVYLADVKNDERAKELKLSETRGAVVGRVVEGSPASKAGLKENDVILSFDNEVIRSAAQVHRMLVETPPGRTVTLKISRAGVVQTVNVTLGERSFNFMGNAPLVPGADALPKIGEIMPKFPRSFIDNSVFYQDFGGSRYHLGVRVAPLSDQLAQYFGVKGDSGLLVTEVEPNGLAERAGLKAGDCITAANGERVASASELSSVMRRAGKAADKDASKADEPVTLTIVRNHQEQTIKVKPEERKP